MNQTGLPDNKKKIYGGAFSVHDTEVVGTVNNLLCEFTGVNDAISVNADRIKNEFTDLYKSWMFDNFDFSGVDEYKHCCVTQGTTESFAQFYIRYRERYRLRLCKGDYFYHQMMKNLWYSDNFAWLEDEELAPGDVLMISIPFSDTGATWPNLESLLVECDEKQIPVMLDMAYLNLTVGSVFDCKIDLSHPCIEYVVSSLSKVFPVENHRIGIRLQKQKFEDQLYVINEPGYNYINLCSAYIATGLMRQYKSDYMFNKYRSRQLEICSSLDVVPSPCFIFGIDNKNQYPIYNRGRNSNRLCFSRIWDGRHTAEDLV